MSSSKHYCNGGGYWSDLGKRASDAATSFGQRASDNVPDSVKASVGVVKDNASNAATAVGKTVSDNVPTKKQVFDATGVVRSNASLLHGQLSNAATGVGSNIYNNVPDSVKTTASNAATIIGEKASAAHGQVSSAATSAAIYVDDMLNERTFISKVNDRGSRDLHDIFINIQRINNNKESVKEDQLAYNIYLYLFNTIDGITSNIKFDSDVNENRIARMRFKLGIAKYLLDDYQKDLNDNSSNGGKKRKTKKIVAKPVSKSTCIFLHKLFCTFDSLIIIFFSQVHRI